MYDQRIVGKILCRDLKLTDCHSVLIFSVRIWTDKCILPGSEGNVGIECGKDKV